MPSEATPLKPEAGAPSQEDPNSPWYKTCVVKYAVPLALVFYICIAVARILLNKCILNDSSAPVALSAMSCIVTCIMLVPIFIVSPKSFGLLDWRKNGPGFALVTVLVALDLAFTNISMNLLSVSIQQCILAINPATTVIIESIFRRKLAHPVIYMTVLVLCVGPVIANLGVPAGQLSIGGIIAQIVGVFNSSCKYVFAHSVMQACKKDLGSFAFLFWLDLATLIILVPWAFIDHSFFHLFSSIHSGADVGRLIGTSILGGMRFFSQLVVLRVTTPTNLACANIGFQAISIYLSMAVFPGQQKITPFLIAGTVLTLLTSGVYTYWKISKVLTKVPCCIKLGEDFNSCVTCKPATKEADGDYSKMEGGGEKGTSR